MKDYKEMTKCVLEARDAHEAKKGKKLSKASGANTASTGEVYSVKKTDKKKVMLGIAPVFGGVLVAVLIGIIVSDYSVDRTEEVSTEIITESTEQETTEELRREMATVATKEEQSNLNENNEPEPDNQSIENHEKKYGIVKRSTNTNNEQSKESDGPGAEENETTVGPGGDTSNAEPNEESSPIKPEEKEPSFETDDPSLNEPIDEDIEAEGPDDLTEGGKFFQWKEVLPGEGDIVYVLCSGSNKFSGSESNAYEKRYKGMTIAGYVFINRDGCVKSMDENGITLEMLQSTDFSSVKKNLNELDAKMIAEGYNRCKSSPNAGTDPVIKKSNQGSSLVYIITYQNDNDSGFNEKYGFSDSLKTRRKVEYDLITGRLLYEYLASIDENGNIVGNPVEIVY